MADLTDLEITKLCAEAMGLILDTAADPRKDSGEIRFLNGRSYDRYAPLHDDAQAMALVKRFRISLDSSNPDEWAVYGSKHITTFGGFSADLNRAICECVARMQLEKNRA